MRLDPIVIGEYDPSWPARFAAQRDAVTGVLAAWLVRDVEHMGSTAVPGLAAKDIVDMLAVVADVDAARAAIAPMAEIGWIHAPEPTDETERRLSFCFPSVARRSHHLHVVEAEPDDWRGWLAFRDHLRAHPDVAREYAALKRTLAAEHGDDPDRRDDYRAGKASFVVDVTARARRGTP